MVLQMASLGQVPPLYQHSNSTSLAKNTRNLSWKLVVLVALLNLSIASAASKQQNPTAVTTAATATSASATATSHRHGTFVPCLAKRRGDAVHRLTRKHSWDSETRETNNVRETALSSRNSLLASRGGAAGSAVQTRVTAAVALLAGLAAVVYTGQEFGLQVLLWLLTPGLFYEATAVVLRSDDILATTHAATTAATDGAAAGTTTTTAAAAANTLTGSATTATVPAVGSSTAITAPPSATKPAVAVAATYKPFTNKWWWFVAYTLGLSSQTNHLVSLADQWLPAAHLVSFGMIVAGFVHMIVGLNARQADPTDFERACEELAVIHLGVILTLVPATVWMAACNVFGKEWVLYAAFLVVINDTAAYIFGKTFGKHALLPTISPNKTWEGWLGALGSTLALSYPLWKALFAGGSDSSTAYTVHAAVLAVYCAVVAPFGGFLASTVKRAYGKKDFGTLIAGHGGLIDRLDCQLVTAPFVYLYLTAVKAAARGIQ